MTNDNKNINELVHADEDPTSELEAITFQDDGPRKETLESDDSTFDFDGRATQEKKTIGKLRYDLEQLRARWAGLEAELRAREELTESLIAQLFETREALVRSERSLVERDSRIDALQQQLREREATFEAEQDSLRARLDAARHEVPLAPRPASKQPLAGDLQGERLARTEDYADLLRRKMQDLLARLDIEQRERTRLDVALGRAEKRAIALQRELAESELTNERLAAELASIVDRHAEEIRMLRFELGEAQETVAQTEVLNSQLASDLVDTRGFKEELERMLTDTDEQSRSRIDQLESELATARRRISELEDKLDARSEAINVLLQELARKSEQVESLSEIGDVISDIGGRIAEQFEEPETETNRSQRSGDRVTRVLVGRIGDKLLRFPLFKDKLTIGRTSDNDIQLSAPFISRRHAVVTTDGEMTRVIDWGSKNGVFVNTRRVTEHFLKNGDIVTIGNAHFRYDERPKRDA